MIKPLMTPAMCIKYLGDHCWEEADSILELGDGTRRFSRHCKHCNIKQIGHDQPSIRWEDV